MHTWKVNKQGTQKYTVVIMCLCGCRLVRRRGVDDVGG
jgi:hypothetical protein